MTTEENDRLKQPVETNSERYGNNIGIEDVYDNLSYPTPMELKDALARTSFLTDQESFAFAYGHIEGFPQMPHESQKANELFQREGFENFSEFISVRQTAKQKIADAIWIYELIDAYRFPDSSTLEKCGECGNILGQTRVGNHHKNGTTPLCSECATVDPDPPHYPTADND